MNTWNEEEKFRPARPAVGVTLVIHALLFTTEAVIATAPGPPGFPTTMSLFCADRVPSRASNSRIDGSAVTAGVPAKTLKVMVTTIGAWLPLLGTDMTALAPYFAG